MKVDLAGFELHNIVRAGERLRTRKALVSLKAAPAGTRYVGSFTIESPNTTEPWHYVLEQNTTTNVVTVRVFTEEFVEIYSFVIGVQPRNPVVTWGVQQMQALINSPSFSAPLYALVGGGMMTATKTASADDTATTLDMPNGHVATFGDRFAVAQGNVELFNDPGIDPRTFVVENALSLPGAIHDHFQGRDGAFYMATTAGIYLLPQDALGQGQEVTGALSRIPNLEVTRPRNAIAAGAGAVVLQRDAAVLVAGGAEVKRIDLSPYDGRRYFSQVVDVEDLRISGELFARPGGFIVGFRGARGHYVDVDLGAGVVSYVTSTASAFNVVGTLRSRDGKTLLVLEDRIVAPWLRGPEDFDGNTVRGVACGRLPIAVGDNPVVRRVVVDAANQGATVGVFVSGATGTATTPVKSTENVIGTALWDAAGTMSGREERAVRLSPQQRAATPHIEVRVDGGDVSVGRSIDVDLGGQGRRRADVS